MNKAIVTGCAGFIGNHLTKRLLERGWKVKGVDNLINGELKKIEGLKNNKNFSFEEKSFQKLEKEVYRENDVIFHLAAQTTVPGSTNNPIKDFNLNAKGTFQSLLKAKEENTDFIYTSTCTVYGYAPTPTKEDAALKPYSLYGASKAVGDLYCSAFNGTFDTRSVSLRLYNVYGPGTKKGVMYDFMDKLTKKPEKLEILGTGQQKKDYVYIKDVIDAIILSAKKGKGGEAYNVGTGISTSVTKIAQYVSDAMDLDPKFSYTGGKSWKGDVEKAEADISKLKDLGWEPRTGIKEGINKMYEWFKENKKYKKV